MKPEPGCPLTGRAACPRACREVTVRSAGQMTRFGPVASAVAGAILAHRPLRQVRQQCLAIAIRTGQACRTRGGLTEGERRAMLLREAAARSASLTPSRARVSWHSWWAGMRCGRLTSSRDPNGVTLARRMGSRWTAVTGSSPMTGAALASPVSRCPATAPKRSPKTCTSCSASLTCTTSCWPGCRWVAVKSLAILADMARSG